jgi:hypothetical protein
MSQKIILFITTAVKTSNATSVKDISKPGKQEKEEEYINR